MIVADEPRHGELGWTTLDWLIDSPWRDDVRRLVAAELDGWIAMFAAGYGAAPTYQVDANERAWGVTDSRETAATWQSALERDLAPRFAKRGFTIAA